MAFNLTGIMDSLKSQTVNLTSNIKIPTSLNLRARTVEDKSTVKPYKWPSLLEQLQWPVIFGNIKPRQQKDEEDIIEKFLKVIQAEEEGEEENVMSTFYNHPQRV